MRKRAKVDSNHAEVRDALVQMGYLVLSLAAVGGGVPDLLVYQPSRKRFGLVEVKQRKGTLTPDQVKFQADGWPVTIVRSVDDALAL